MGSFSISSKVEPDADDDCVAEEEVLYFSYLLHSLLIHLRLAVSVVRLENFDDFTIASSWERHSPGDWIEDDLEVEMSKDNWSPRARLSKRMSENGNSWRNIRSSSPALPVSEQKPLLDPNQEGEKFPFVAENRLSVDSETIEDLRRLCVVFQHVEKLLTLAASLHRKFLQAPRLAREIFSDFYNFYVPRMGICLLEEKCGMKREKWCQICLFNPLQTNLGEMLSMGNLLNVHESIQREIIFSLHGMNGNHYAIPTASVSQQNIETYRMYICGTSNDLRIALSVLLSRVINFMLC
ncbi:hypothetical protein VNO80_05497 [Phaseolus coccineus]|uniref:Rab3 GTPase-activating protein catalytic subunit n=1 Tax=Phaseolus coccineus TaxID=3886 RepID=A0AAN9NM26_PHACN